MILIVIMIIWLIFRFIPLEANIIKQQQYLDQYLYDLFSKFSSK